MIFFKKKKKEGAAPFFNDLSDLVIHSSFRFTLNQGRIDLRG